MLNYQQVERKITRLLEPINYGLLKHSIGVAQLSQQIAMELGEKDPKLFYLSGLAHDLGKCTWPKEMHYKFPLTSEEWLINHQHPLIGAEIFQEMFPQMSEEFIIAIAQHHERPGGGGTPRRLNEICHIAQILAVADQYDAMTSSRPYRPNPFPPILAVSEITRKEKIMPVVIDALIKVLKSNKTTLDTYSEVI